AVDFRIDAVDRLAVSLIRDIDRPGFDTDQTTLADRLGRQAFQFVRRPASRQFSAAHDVGVRNRFRTRNDLTVARRTVARRHTEQLRALLHERDASSGTGLAQRLETLPYRPAAAGDHESPLRIGIDMPDA